VLCEWKQGEVIELAVREDHLYLLVSIPPKVSILKLLGILKAKTAIKFLKIYPRMKKSLTGETISEVGDTV